VRSCSGFRVSGFRVLGSGFWVSGFLGFWVSGFLGSGFLGSGFLGFWVLYISKYTSCSALKRRRATTPWQSFTLVKKRGRAG
jgi:hypothetical protein